MRNKLIAGRTTIVAAGAIVAPAQAQVVSPAPSTLTFHAGSQPTPSPRPGEVAALTPAPAAGAA